MGFVKELLISEQRSSIERWVRDHAYGVPMPGGDTLCRVLGEFMFVVTLDDHSVAPHLVMNGYWEMWVTMCLAKRVKPGWQCIDVGANFGYYTVLLADLVGETGKVEAWEPSTAVRERLTKTVELSGMAARIQHVGWAAGAESGECRLVRREHDYGSAYIAKSYQEGHPELTQILTYQHPLSTSSIAAPDFVKIDAEGMEPEIWQSLGDHLPKAALIEWTPKKYADAPAFLALLRGQGYTVSLVNQHGDLEKVSGDALMQVEGWQALWLDRQA